MENSKKTGDFGSMFGIIIVVIVLLFGAFYFTKQRIQKSEEFKATINLGGVGTTPTSSDDIIDIENSVNSMNFDDLGSGIDSL